MNEAQCSYFQYSEACLIVTYRWTQTHPVGFILKCFFFTLIREPKEDLAYRTSECKRNTLSCSISFLCFFLQCFITPFLCSTLEYSISRPLSPPWVLLMIIESDNWQQSSKLTVLVSWKTCMCVFMCVGVCAGLCVVCSNRRRRRRRKRRKEEEDKEVSSVLFISDWVSHGHLTLYQSKV